MIKFENVSYVYNKGTVDEKKAIDNINLTISTGEFIGIAGHTGSGKSTLIQHFNGLLKASLGKVYVDDEDIYNKKYKLSTLRGKVGLVFQYPEYQLFETTVIKDVCFGPLNQGLDEESALKRAKKALEYVSLDESFYELSPFDLSGGQKRRVAIAGVLAMKPKVLVLDEPSAGLDPKGKKEIFELLSYLNKEKNITIVFVSHSMEDIANYAKRMIVMDKSKIIFDGDTKKVFENRDKLEQIGLSVPCVTYVCDELKKRGIRLDDNPITVQEAKNTIINYFVNKK